MAWNLALRCKFPDANSLLDWQYNPSYYSWSLGRLVGGAGGHAAQYANHSQYQVIVGDYKIVWITQAYYGEGSGIFCLGTAIKTFASASIDTGVEHEAEVSVTDITNGLRIYATGTINPIFHLEEFDLYIKVPKKKLINNRPLVSLINAGL